MRGRGLSPTLASIDRKEIAYFPQGFLRSKKGCFEPL